jgi:hypothetical protein
VNIINFECLSNESMFWTLSARYVALSRRVTSEGWPITERCLDLHALPGWFFADPSCLYVFSYPCLYFVSYIHAFIENPTEIAMFFRNHCDPRAQRSAVGVAAQRGE